MLVLDKLWNELNLPYKLAYLKKDSDIEFDFEEVIRQLVSGEFLHLGLRLRPAD